ncbi:NERD domain-containing protein [Bacillus sp. FJAT-50079]|nr:NERD domain-containing protein [Bacillus sp. FJAT-50079]
MNFSMKEKKYYLNLEKGYQGEVKFAQLTRKLECEGYILHDLCLEYNHSLFQIDTLIISQKTIFPIEVKNYDGDYVYESREFRSHPSNQEIMNPLDQLKRSQTLLRSLLKSHGIHFQIESYVAFVNPEFTLYQAPVHAPIIFPSQLNVFMKKLNELPLKLDDQHKKLANLLISLHQKESPYARLPSYDASQLKKGITCNSCRSFEMSILDRELICVKCGCIEQFESAVLRIAEEIRLLFPEKKITTRIVYEWCKGIKSKKSIHRILMKNFRSMGVKKHRYFE